MKPAVLAKLLKKTIRSALCTFHLHCMVFLAESTFHASWNLIDALAILKACKLTSIGMGYILEISLKHQFHIEHNV